VWDSRQLCSEGLRIDNAAKISIVNLSRPQLLKRQCSSHYREINLSQQIVSESATPQQFARHQDAATSIACSLVQSRSQKVRWP
jgi:hypothetical protein